MGLQVTKSHKLIEGKPNKTVAPSILGAIFMASKEVI
jgi:hypothetical protein